MPLISHLPPYISDTISRSHPTLKLPEARSFVSLDSSGVAGFFGGDHAVGAMATVYLLPLRTWFGWYNSPGSYEIAREYGQIADSPFWDGLFPGSSRETTEFFGLNGKTGPPFHGVYSGWSDESTGHLAYLLFDKMPRPPVRLLKQRPPSPVPTPTSSGNPTPSAQTQPAGSRPNHYVTVIYLTDPQDEDNAVKSLPQDGCEIDPLHVGDVYCPIFLRCRCIVLLFVALVPIISSIVTCVLCVLVADWWCFSSILFGMIAGGVAYRIIGSGKLILRRPPVPDAPAPGDGVLWRDNEIVVLLGPQEVVDVVTRSKFHLQFVKPSSSTSKPVQGVEDEVKLEDEIKEHELEEDEDRTRHLVGWCSILLSLQFLSQLLFIPQGTLFGQLMFVISLAVSWMCNMYVSAMDREKAQMSIMLRFVPHLQKAVQAHETAKRNKEPAARSSRLPIKVKSGSALARHTLTRQRSSSSQPLIRASPAPLPKEAEGLKRFLLPSRQAAAVLSLLILQGNRSNTSTQHLRTTLDKLIPNDTPLWNEWKDRAIKLVVTGECGDNYSIDSLLKEEITVLKRWVHDAKKVHEAWKNP